MTSTEVVERFVRDGWAGADSHALDATVSGGMIKQAIGQFTTAFADVELLTLGPIFSDATDSMVAAYGEMHIRQVAQFLDVTAIGGAADCGFTAIFQIDDGKITQMWMEMDFAALYATV